MNKLEKKLARCIKDLTHVKHLTEYESLSNQYLNLQRRFFKQYGYLYNPAYRQGVERHYHD